MGYRNWEIGTGGWGRGASAGAASWVIVPLVLCGLVFAACDGAGGSAFEPEFVVEAFVIAGEPLQPVRLSRTAPLSEPYDFTALAVRDAEVALELLDEAGGVAERFAYAEDPARPGVYVPTAPRPALPLRRYRLDVLPPGGGRISATTLVPDTFRVVGANTREAVYQSTAQLEITLTRSLYPGRDQAYFVFSTEALDPVEEQLTPLAASILDFQEDELTLEDLRVGASPIFNEANYDLNADGTLTIRYPWLAIAFFGPNRLTAHVLGDNLYDYIRSQSVQQGGSTFSPGEIPNPIEHLDGARGVFGSYARQTFELFVKRPEEAECAVIGGAVICGEAEARTDG